MTWFRIDDDFAFHAKVVKAGNAAIGLWARAGAWCAQHLTDGFIPEHVISILGSPAQRKKLISVGLWIEGVGGCQFHEWNENGRQPTREKVLHERSKSAERKAKSRKNLAENLEISEEPQVRGGGHASVTRDPRGRAPGARPDPTRSKTPSESYETPSESLGELALVRGDPAAERDQTSGQRSASLAVQPPLIVEVPVPSPPAPAEKPSTKGHRLPEDWTPTPGTVTWSQQQAQAAGLDITTEWAKFRDYWLSKPGAAGRKTDWDRTWRNWVRGAIERMPSWKRQQAGPAPLTNAQKRRQDGLSLLAQIAAEEETRRSASANRRAIQA